MGDVDQPLTDRQLVDCAAVIVRTLERRRPGIVRMVEHSELEGMAREAVLAADRRYQATGAARRTWAITKGLWIVQDMLRREARHTVCLTEGEFRDRTVRPRVAVPMGDPDPPDGDEHDALGAPARYLRSTSPSPLDVALRRELRARLEAALDGLGDQRAAAAFRLMAWHDWTQEDVGELFGISGSRVSQLQTRARVHLQAAFPDVAAERRVA